MKKKIWARVNWSTKKALKMASIAHGIAKAMDGNAAFPAPPIKTADLDVAATRVELAFANRKNGKLGKDELFNSSNELDVMLHYQADYVSITANGDETIIHSAAFETINGNDSLAKTAHPTANVAAVLKAESGGVVKAKVEPVKNARNYCFVMSVDTPINTILVNGQISFDVGAKVFVINSTKSSAVFTGLPKLKTVYVAVIISNANGDSGFSPVSTVLTLP